MVDRQIRLPILDSINMIVIRFKIVLDDPTLIRIAKHLHPEGFTPDFQQLSYLYRDLQSIRVTHLDRGKVDAHVRIDADYRTVERRVSKPRFKGFEETTKVKLLRRSRSLQSWRVTTYTRDFSMW
jgi:hypothetical protein